MSPRVLITGASGFAGRHLQAACREAGDEVVVASRAAGVDLRRAEATRACVAAARPDVVYHLAALAHVGSSWRDPAGVFRDNTAMVRTVLDAVLDVAPDAVVVVAGSGEAYGPPSVLPVTEDALLRPQNPYAVSKAAADLLAGFYADAHGLRVLRARPFNHAGPGQEPIYAIASFARQVAGGLEAREAAGGGGPLTVVTGNPETRRDFTDVRDVVAAYRALAGSDADPGAYNVCSGVTASAAELVAALAAGCDAEIEHTVDERLLRPHEVMEIRGSFARLQAATGWEPRIALEQTLADAVAWWREEIRAGRAGERISEAS